MFVNFILSKLKIKASVCLKLKENSVLQFSVSEFHLVQPSFTKHFLLLWRIGVLVVFISFIVTLQILAPWLSSESPEKDPS